MDEWNGVVAKAKEILGDKRKIPKMKPALVKGGEIVEKAWAPVDKGREELEAKALALIDAYSQLVDAAEQYRDVIDEEDFGLAPKNKDDAKKIADARKLLVDRIVESAKGFEENRKNVRELNKHLANLANDKPVS